LIFIIRKGGETRRNLRVLCCDAATNFLDYQGDAWHAAAVKKRLDGPVNTKAHRAQKAQKKAQKEGQAMTPAAPAEKLASTPTNLKVVEGGMGKPVHQPSQDLTQAQLEQAHKTMLFARRFEEKAASLYQQKEIQGFCHLYIGQEAVAVGTKMASQQGDEFITSYRCHAMGLVCGLTGEEVMGELMGRKIGISKGKGGSMHMFDPARHFWGGHGIVAAQAPLGAGLAFARQYQNDVQGKTNTNVSFTFMGDGSTNAGQFFESLNMAALWKLPVVFIIENNVWGMGTSVSRAAAGELYRRGEPFGIACAKADGMDVMAVYDAVKAATDHVRAGHGPYLLELETYRYRGHSMSDPAKYRTREDVECVKAARDPIDRLQKHLVETFNMTPEHFEKVDEAVKDEIARIVETCTNAPRPDIRDLTTDVMPA
jgi:pyruvate dehydrogenase E1 component alpha subunit